MTATKQKKECKVVFMPSGKRGYFDKGTSLLGAARQLGVDIDSVCGGRALCGRCQVEVTEGDFSKHNIHSSFASMEIITEAENKYHER